ncbi:hypothetical protein R3P38DRAFT_2794154 [Favolaschia claudopus]|uniref:Uncharacterized protein n=1 Tax=Favolaschia claudopus TaxID=2862362 RepID=A0AAW0AC66_9AGAR
MFHTSIQDQRHYSTSSTAFGGASKSGLHQAQCFGEARRWKAGTQRRARARIGALSAMMAATEYEGGAHWLALADAGVIVRVRAFVCACALRGGGDAFGVRATHLRLRLRVQTRVVVRCGGCTCALRGECEAVREGGVPLHLRADVLAVGLRGRATVQEWVTVLEQVTETATVWSEGAIMGAVADVFANVGRRNGSASSQKYVACEPDALSSSLGADSVPRTKEREGGGRESGSEVERVLSWPS